MMRRSWASKRCSLMVSSLLEFNEKVEKRCTIEGILPKTLKKA